MGKSIMLHGTHSGNIEAILEEGLKPYPYFELAKFICEDDDLCDLNQEREFSEQEIRFRRVLKSTLTMNGKTSLTNQLLVSKSYAELAALNGIGHLAHKLYEAWGQRHPDAGVHDPAILKIELDYITSASAVLLADSIAPSMISVLGE